MERRTGQTLSGRRTESLRFAETRSRGAHTRNQVSLSDEVGEARVPEAMFDVTSSFPLLPLDSCALGVDRQESLTPMLHRTTGSSTGHPTPTHVVGTHRFLRQSSECGRSGQFERVLPPDCVSQTRLVGNYLFMVRCRGL